jgi:hypothetical protein
VRARSPWTRTAAAAATLGLIASCGRRATHADCELIVDKSVELQLKELSATDAADVKKRVEQVRAALQDDIASCEGRRVTDRTVACVQAAKATKELDQCLR